jgi:hypothetical protein
MPADTIVVTTVRLARFLREVGRPAKPNEFGKLVKLQEAENQIVTEYESMRGGPTIRICSSTR